MPLIWSGTDHPGEHVLPPAVWWQWGVVAAVLALGTGPLRAQTIQGVVEDSVSATRLAGTTVSVNDSRGDVVASVSTAQDGVFRFSGLRAEWLSISVRRPGYQPVNMGPFWAPGLDTALRVRMQPLAVGLDTMVTRATESASFSVTPGREFFRRHLLEGKGIFISGLEMSRSKLGVSDFLSTVPGIELKTNVVKFNPAHPLAGAPPTVPASNGRHLVSTGQSGCLYARVDRWSLPMLLLREGAINLDEVLKVEEIMAVEVYGAFSEVPAEWRMDAWVYRLIWVQDPWNLLMGDHWRSSEIPSLDRLFIPRNTAASPAQQQPDPVRLRGAPVYQMTLAPIPPCGFIQIWTTQAW